MREAILELMSRSFDGAERLSPMQRADLYEAAARLLEGTTPDLNLLDHAAAADRAARSLRDAEAHQLVFTQILQGKEGA